MIAVTQSDETNLVACKLAQQLFNVPTRIVRLRATDYLTNEKVLGPDCFDVDLAICPEQVLTDYIVKLIEFPEALQVLEFAHGKVSLVAVRAFQGGPLVGHPLKDLKKDIPNVDARIAAIFRGDAPVLPDGDTVVQAGDEVFCLAASKDIRQVMHELRRMDKPVRRVIIAGGGNIGLRLARALELFGQGDRIRQAALRDTSSRLDRALVLQGDVTDEKLLEAENVSDMDLFVAVTNDDENNIMSCLLAKRMGARRVVALINRRSYVDLLHAGQIDIAISPAQATIGTLLAHVRRGTSPAGPQPAPRRGRWRSKPWCTAIASPRVAPGGGSRRSTCPKAAISGVIVRGDEVVMAHHDTLVRRRIT